MIIHVHKSIIYLNTTVVFIFFRKYGLQKINTIWYITFFVTIHLRGLDFEINFFLVTYSLLLTMQQDDSLYFYYVKRSKKYLAMIVEIEIDCDKSWKICISIAVKQFQLPQKAFSYKKGNSASSHFLAFLVCFLFTICQKVGIIY